MNLVTDIMQSIHVVHILWYWAALTLLDFGLIQKYAVLKRWRLMHLSLGIWIPAGALVPLVWLVQQANVTLLTGLIVTTMMTFYAIIRPLLWRRKILSLEQSTDTIP